MALRALVAVVFLVALEMGCETEIIRVSEVCVLKLGNSTKMIISEPDLRNCRVFGKSRDAELDRNMRFQVSAKALRSPAL